MPNLLNPSRFGAGAFVNPTSISGLVAWYSAESETAYVDNANIATWNDRSGLGNHATAATTPKWRSTQGSAGGPAIEFNNSGFFNLPNILGSATAGEIMVTIKATGTSNGTWWFGQGTGNGSESHYPFGTDVYESFGCPNAVRPSWAAGAIASAWHRYGVWSALNDFDAHIDEVSKVTQAAYTPSFTTTPYIGAGHRDIGIDLKFTGFMGGVAIYNRKLTTTERTNLGSFFNTYPSGGNP